MTAAAPVRAGALTTDILDVERLSPAFLAEWAAAADHPINQPFVVLDCWRELCRADGALQVIAVRRGGELVGVAPLARGGGPVRRWIAPSHAEVGRVNFVVRDDPAEVVGAALAAVMQAGADVIEVPTVTTDSRTYVGLQAAAARLGLAWIEDPICDVPYKRLEGGWDAVWKSINGDTRRKFGQQERRLQKLGELTYAEHREAENLDALLAECFEIEASGYKGDQRTAIKYREAEGRFWRRFIPDALQAGTLSIYTLRLSGRLISYEISLKHAGVIYAMKHGTDVRVEAQAPGNALHLNIFRQEAAAGTFPFYDFAGEMTEWKRRWSKDVLSMVGIRLYASGPRGRMAYWTGPGFRRGVKHVPGAMTVVSSLRDFRKKLAMRFRQWRNPMVESKGSESAAAPSPQTQSVNLPKGNSHDREDGDAVQQQGD